LSNLRREALVERIVQGPGWIVAIVRGTSDQRAAGMAAIPHEVRGRCCIPGRIPDTAPQETGFQIVPDEHEHGDRCAQLLLSPDAGAAAVGLAVTNAIIALDPEPAAPVDGVDWLLARAAGRDVAVVGGFPFIDRELRPIARNVWVLEREPRETELPENRAPDILPVADIVVITASALANHSLDRFLRLARPAAVRILLGPSTPLTSSLFAFGFDALSGVRISEIDTVAREVAHGVPFRRMSGLERVTLRRHAAS
jgi:uncharacterized protein (DUF4213/DUF364 family)